MTRTARLIAIARRRVRADKKIPLDLFAELMGAGIDVTELERTARNGA